jgi:hypothetical protein
MALNRCSLKKIINYNGLDNRFWSVVRMFWVAASFEVLLERENSKTGLLPFLFVNAKKMANIEDFLKT